MKIARVFARKTRACPVDDLAFFAAPDMFAPEVDEVHVSVTFTYDKERGERFAEAWSRIAPVKIGGPAYDDPGGDFAPGMYLKHGYVITSRGCPNRCWFCDVPRREGIIRELPITEGWNVLDSNLLACSEAHIRLVFAMLKEQKQRVEFTGGLEAARLQPWHVEELAELHPRQVFFAYDTPSDYEPLVDASKLLADGGLLERHRCRCFVLIGYPHDDRIKAELRLRQVIELGMDPMAMLYRNEHGTTDSEWRKFQRVWARPALIYASERR